MKRGLLTIVLPACNEAENIERSVQILSGICKQAAIPFELLFVDDGSGDCTWDSIVRAAEKDPGVRGIRFSRNFGKEAAIMAGLAEAKGDCAAVMDCDLQHPPEKIAEMYDLWQNGYEVIEGRKADRGKESYLHRTAANYFYTLISAATGLSLANTSDFKLLDRKAVNVLLKFNEKHLFFRALSQWIGFRTASVHFHVQERFSGITKWSTLKLVKYAVSNIASFSTLPMQLITLFGAMMFLVFIVFSGITFVQKITGIALPGFTTIIILQLFSSSLIMMGIGIVGYYVARIFDEVKNRPLYIVSKRAGATDKTHE